MGYDDRSLAMANRVILRAKFHWLHDVAAWGGACAGRDPADFLRGAAGPGAVWRRRSGDLGDGAVRGPLPGLLRQRHGDAGAQMDHRGRRYQPSLCREICHHPAQQRTVVPNIEGVVNQGVLGRIFGYGKMDRGTGDDSVLTPTIADPVGFSARFRRLASIRPEGA